jgi:hypothetical protein
MSATIQLGAMYCKDQDGAWGINCTANMAARNTTIGAVGVPIVTRQDGAAIGPNDLTVTGYGVVNVPTNMAGVVVQPGYGFTFSTQTNGNTAVYVIGFPLSLASGDLITRWVSIPSLPTLG